MTWVETGSTARPSFFATCASTRGSMLAKVPTAPEIAQVAISARAAFSRVAARDRTRRNGPASLSPKVVGSAWMPWLRPMQTVFLCSKRALLERGQQPVRSVAAGCRGAARAAPRGRCRARPTRSCPGARSAPRARHARRDWSGRRSRRACVSRSIASIRVDLELAALPDRLRPPIFGITPSAACASPHGPRSRTRCGTGSPAPRSRHLGAAVARDHGGHRPFGGPIGGKTSRATVACQADGRRAKAHPWPVAAGPLVSRPGTLRGDGRQEWPVTISSISSRR